MEALCDLLPVLTINAALIKIPNKINSYWRCCRSNANLSPRLGVRAGSEANVVRIFHSARTIVSFSHPLYH